MGSLAEVLADARHVATWNTEKSEASIHAVSGQGLKFRFLVARWTECGRAGFDGTAVRLEQPVVIRLPALLAETIYKHIEASHDCCHH